MDKLMVEWDDFLFKLGLFAVIRPQLWMRSEWRRGNHEEKLNKFHEQNAKPPSSICRVLRSVVERGAKNADYG